MVWKRKTHELIFVFAKLASRKRPNPKRGDVRDTDFCGNWFLREEYRNNREPLDVEEITHFHRATGQVS
jgi:hypothetical protein